MADPAKIDIVLPSRRIDFPGFFTFLGEDFSGSTLLMHVRQVPGTTGTPALSAATGSGLSIVYAGTDTVANHATAGRVPNSGEGSIYNLVNPSTAVPYVAADNVTLSQILIDLDAADLAALPAVTPPGETGDPATFAYDIIRTPVSGNAELIMAGKFMVNPGVTIP